MSVIVPSSLTIWLNGGIGAGKSLKVTTKAFPGRIISALFVEVATPGLAVATAGAGVWPGVAEAGAVSDIPGTSENPESALSVWHPLKSAPANTRQDSAQKRPHTCPTFVITMKPLILLKPSSRRALYRLRCE